MRSLFSATFSWTSPLSDRKVPIDPPENTITYHNVLCSSPQMLQKHCFHWGQVNSQEKLLVLERDQKRDQAKSKALEILSPKFCRYLSTSKIIRANPHPRRPRGIQSGREKSAGRKFSSTGGRAPGYRLSPNYFQKFKHMSPPDWTRNTCFVLLCPIGEQFLLSSFREFVHDGYGLGYCLFTLARFVLQACACKESFYFLLS